MKKIIICKECGEEKTNYSRGVCCKCYQRIWHRDARKRFPEKFKEYDRKTHERRWSLIREKNNISRQKRYYENQERELETRIRYYEENKEKIRERQRSYYRSTGNARWQRRESRRRGLPSTLTNEEWNETLLEFNNKCAYCGSESNITKDHVIPLSRGGGYTKENIVPACKSCNSRKKDKTAEEFLEYIKRTDSLRIR